MTTPRLPSSNGAKASAAVLFSGGGNSALAALRVGERFERVHLLCCVARGLVGAARVEEHVLRLTRHVADPTRFQLHVLSVDRLIADLADHGRLGALFKYGFLSLSHRPAAHLAFHLRALAHCREHGISHLFDGLAPPRPGEPSRIEDLLRDRLAALHAGAGVRLEHPILAETTPVEETLYSLRYNRAAVVRDSKADARIVDEWDTLDRMADPAAARADNAALTRRQTAWFATRMDRAEALVSDWTRHAPGAHLAGLLQA